MPQPPTEARNDAMGGTGVASSNYLAAALANPALMTRHDGSDDVGLILPGVGAQISDPDNLRDGLERVKPPLTTSAIQRAPATVHDRRPR